jgi:LytS/YehU family sensor histidine kinase
MAALETRDVITIVSAIVLPMIFFTVGKSIDVLLQIHLRKRDKTKNETDSE